MPSRASKTVVATLCVLMLGATLLAQNALAEANPWEKVQVRLISSVAGSPVTAVIGTLPSSASLPATGVLSIPAGVNPHWVGEILGSATSKDPTATFSVAPANGYNAVTVTLTKSHIAQIEYDDPGALAKTGQSTQASVSWTSPGAEPSVALSVVVPTGATVTSNGGATAETIGGTPFYTKTYSAVTTGQVLALSIAYNGGTGQAPPQSASARWRTALPFVIGVALAALLIYIVVRQRRRSQRADESASFDDNSDVNDVDHPDELADLSADDFGSSTDDSGDSSSGESGGGE